jgi:alkanesulfonate monooxygenase SsuD/methylene tetrahydromethanopterin reductase-like flavin-dependent oxidoreductase (luciferase family)
VRFGSAIMNIPQTVPAEQMPCCASKSAAADAGIGSVWVLQHYLGNMPTLQPLPLLAALAAEAGDMFLGTNMFILPLSHPVAVAENYATLITSPAGG